MFNNEAELKEKLINICKDTEHNTLKKVDYILRSFSKIKHKQWELYAVTRIIHSLSDLDIEFVCQQNIKKQKNGERRQLLDLCFPNLECYVEIDEPHHEADLKKEADKLRDDEVYNKTKFSLYRIKIKDKPLDKINEEIASVVKKIQSRKIQFSKKGKFEVWDTATKYSSIQHIKRGVINAEHNVAFRHHRGALRCFGCLDYITPKGHHQGATWGVPNTDAYIWFPKLYENDNWVNTLSENWNEITMEMTQKMKKKTKTQNSIKGKNPNEERPDNPIVFAHYMNALNLPIYKFLGQYKKVDEQKGKAIFRRTKKEISLVEYWQRSDLIG